MQVLVLKKEGFEGLVVQEQIGKNLGLILKRKQSSEERIRVLDLHVELILFYSHVNDEKGQVCVVMSESQVQRQFLVRVCLIDFQLGVLKY